MFLTLGEGDRVFAVPRRGQNLLRGLQARINELLKAVDRYGDFEGGGRKLDTYFVVHEKVAGLFGLLCDAVEKNLSPWYYPILLLVVI